MRFHDLCDPLEGSRRIRRVVQDANRIRELKCLRTKRQREDIGLDQMDTIAPADVAIRRVNRRREINPEYFGTLGGGTLGESPGPNPGVEQPPPAIFLVAPPGGCPMQTKSAILPISSALLPA